MKSLLLLPPTARQKNFTICHCGKAIEFMFGNLNFTILSLNNCSNSRPPSSGLIERLFNHDGPPCYFILFLLSKPDIEVLVNLPYECIESPTPYMNIYNTIPCPNVLNFKFFEFLSGIIFTKLDICFTSYCQEQVDKTSYHTLIYRSLLEFTQD